MTEQIDSGQRFIERFVADGNSVRAAFWAKSPDDEGWTLFVAMDVVDSDGPAVAYRAVLKTLSKIEGSWVSKFDVKVIGSADAIAKDVLAIVAKYPNAGPSGTWSGRTALGRMAIDGVYIYPEQFLKPSKPNPMTREVVGREIVRLMDRSPGVLQPSRVTLKDATSFLGVPFALEIGSQRKVQVKFVEERQAVPRVVPLDDIAAIT